MDKQRQEQGQGLVEYALIASLVALVAILILNILGVSLQDIFISVVRTFQGEGQPTASEETSTTLFSDDFEDGLGNWKLLDEWFWKDQAKTEDGNLELGKLSAIINDDIDSDDYIINVNDVSMKKTGNNWNGFGVFFRTNDASNLDAYIFEVEKVNKWDNGNIYFRKWENGNQLSKPLASITVPASFDWSNPGDIQVRVEGDTFTASIDGEQILQATDSSFSSGGVGLASNFGSKLTVDDIEVISIP